MKDEILKLLREAEDGYISGQEISEKFGVSRTAVWKAIRQLEKVGYTIEAVRNRGYRLKTEPDIITDSGIRKYLTTKHIASKILTFDTIDSTNLELKRRADAGETGEVLAVSDEQTAGRGRRGRSWDSVKGTNIAMSILLKPDIMPGNASMLTLVMGMAVRDAIAEAAGLECGIKWPNDIVTDGKKVCGILTEMSAQIGYINYLVVGIGINVHNKNFPEEISTVATSVDMAGGKNVSRNQIVALTMNYFEKYYETFLKTQDLSELMKDYNGMLVNFDQSVRVLDPMGEYTGIARGINSKGELLVETDDGIKNVMSGEVSVRGVYGYV